MSPWPPSVLVATHQDVMRHAVREMLRNCGIRELVFSSSTEAVLSTIEREARKWQVLILEASLPDAMDILGSAKEVKTILIISGPTREAILTAIQAGVNDILTYPFSEATLEKKLRKLTDTAKADVQAEKRRSPRFDLPAVVEAPALSKFPLVPEDLSAGGFKVTVPKPPAPDAVVGLSLEVAEVRFEGCRARVAWVTENETATPTWSVGLAMEMGEAERGRLADLLRASAEKNESRAKTPG